MTSPEQRLLQSHKLLQWSDSLLFLKKTPPQLTRKEHSCAQAHGKERKNISNTRYIVSNCLREYTFELNKMRDFYKFTRHTAATQLIDARVNAATNHVLIVHRSASIRLNPLTSQGNFSGK